MKSEEIINDDAIYTIRLYKGKNHKYDMLEVVSSEIEAGDLKTSNNANSILCVNLDLSDADDLDILKRDKSRPKLREIDTQFSFNDEEYKISNIDKFKNEVRKYNKIRIWVDHKHSNSFLSKLYFCNEFYEQIYDKNIIIANIDGYFFTTDKIKDFIKKKKVFEAKLNTEKLDEYKNEWDIQVKINSEIRDVRNGKIINLSYSDLYEPSFEIIKSLGRVKRSETISKLMESNILNHGSPIVYNYIINCLIKNNLLRVYMKDYSNRVINDYENQDEFRNNEIEYYNK